jgi:hypothetical protein
LTGTAIKFGRGGRAEFNGFARPATGDSILELRSYLTAVPKLDFKKIFDRRNRSVEVLS